LEDLDGLFVAETGQVNVVDLEKDIAGSQAPIQMNSSTCKM
jgi:hypothetical protein